MTTSRQDKDFRDQMISDSLLDNAIGWIRENLMPEEVFTDGQLRDWAEENMESK